MLYTIGRMQAVLSAALVLSVAGGAAAQDQTIAEERAEIDREAEAALNQLFTEEPSAQRLYEQAAGYAVFTNYKFAAGIVAGGGDGVAVNKQTGERVYMNMGTAGVAAGLGGQRYRLVVLLESEQDFNEFINDQWEATANANAVVGEAGANVATNFRQGVLIYPLTDAGLMLNADITGTRFWVDEELNQGLSEQGSESGESLTNEDVLEHEGQYREPVEQEQQ